MQQEVDEPRVPVEEQDERELDERLPIENPEAAMGLRVRLILVVIATLLTAFPSLAAAQPVVNVNCARGDSINRALARQPRAESLIVEVRGTCVENVVIDRTRVTLRGADPATDGIRSPRAADHLDAALTVTAELVTVENLTLADGTSGVLAMGVNLPYLTLRNCRVEDNSMYGVWLEGSSVVRAEDSILTNNGSNAAVFGGAFYCLRCTLSDPTGHQNVLGFNGGYVNIAMSEVRNGEVRAGGLTVVSDTRIEALPGGRALNSPGQGIGHGSLTRVELSGSVVLAQGATFRFFGVTQTSGSTLVAEDSFLRLADAPPQAGGPPSIPSTLAGLALTDFSKASIQQTSSIQGNLACSSGATAVCVDPAQVSGTSTCGGCPKP